MKEKVALVLGTARAGNKSIRVAKYLEEFLSKNDEVEVRLVDPATLDLSGDENTKIAGYSEVVDWADTFILIVPEYNHSFSGTLKKMLDTEMPAYLNKAVGLVGVSVGSFGGVRAVQSLLPVVRELGLIAHGYDLFIPRVNESLSEEGEVLDESLNKRTEKFVSKLLWLSRTLKAGRQNLK